MALKAVNVINDLQAKGYTPQQVVNSLERKLAWVEKLSKSPIEKSVYRKAISLATSAAAKAYVEAGPGGLHCDARCEWAVDDLCECDCQGINHGFYRNQQAPAEAA